MNATAVRTQLPNITNTFSVYMWWWHSYNGRVLVFVGHFFFLLIHSGVAFCAPICDIDTIYLVLNVFVIFILNY